jgi:site-specific DNA-methyltransferase (adenine-specific)
MINKGMFTSNTDVWSTPPDFYKKLDEEFHFDFDPCPLNPTFDGLQVKWGKRNYMNPPYGRVIGKWVKKASENKMTVCLLPARTDTRWFHDYIYNKAEIRFIKGRLKFGNSKNSAPFPSMIVIFK